MNWQLTTYGGVLKDGYLWFSNNTFNGLFRMNNADGKIDFVASFPDEDMNQTAMHKKCIAVNNRIYFFPALGKHIHIYDLSSRKISSMEFSGGEIDACSDAVLVQDKIYIFPADSQSDLHCLDTKTNTLFVIPSFRKQYEKLKNIHKTYLLCRVSYFEKKFVFAFFDTDIVATFDPDTDALMTFHTGIPHLFAAYENFGKLYLTTNNTAEIFEYDFEGSPQIIYFESMTNPDLRRFNQICFLNQTIFALPAFWGNVVQLQGNQSNQLPELFRQTEKDQKEEHTKEDGLENSEEEPKQKEAEASAILSFGFLYMNDHLVLFPFTQKYLYEIDEKGYVTRNISCVFSASRDRDELANKRFLASEDKCACEEEDFSITSLIEALKNDKS